MSTNVDILPEAEQLHRTFKGEPGALIGFVERQLNTLHMRAQVVIGFAAVAITTTGFSGRLIAGTNTAAQFCIIAGLSLILFSCTLLFLRVLSIEWVVSRYLQDDLLACISSMIRYRDRKTSNFRLGCIGIFVGMTIYGIALSIMLLNPEPLNVPIR